MLGSLHVGGPFWASMGSLELVGPEGDLYTIVSDPYPHVRRYDVVLPGEGEQS